MADTPETNGAANPATGNAAAQAPKITQRVIAQYIRDMSFENILAQKGAKGEVQPEIQVQVNLDARKRGTENQYEVITKLNITSKTKESGDPLFVMEVEYAGVFQIEGVPEEQMHPYLLIECPRITFPFLRRIVSDVTRDGGFAPLNLETIDFLQLYRSELARRAQANQAGQGGETPASA
ncbi:protein-export chaperone SecB [Ponticoccus sp. SC2-23]|uniref:protein-export chaperone SecB n=1 Tax=Alexandriicola marinus TaxID=2081710 RepID=UPI000FDA1A66|nr:protein-export chaperone SecB [Alexandriicola marinus]MBM1220732.1 protein-export chaperone SecB [Ponticoccus sp. SC6-9]MBM1225991.1 protein-export chaperone SecB [Ponticoccus sp. SC6-15]MBM1231288.1 protein-export chaperone SecB [Ponticoccus sp. SC6-38]MBM1235851.1 protein-export chaperone SecB [Ponticoccus sp. SC6-45]MBM1240311.1 protein-export chaperone SecB [Ponticoccus sp. SC6-49]MBM1244846.1 protein-export chaperone SecB [Ponticoccus sp. SC2-64]MBM1249325.1 protein-export chaperone 